MKYVNGLHFNNLRGGIFGGITAAVVALPLALAFGVSSGAGPVAGLYGAIFAALFGGTPAQVSGPTGPMTVVMAAMFTQYTTMFPGDPAHGAAIAFTVVIMGGAFQILFGAMRFGQYISMVPHPVISGFMIKVGTDIIDWDYLKRLRKAPLAGVVMMFTVLGITVFVDLITAVAVGVVMASLIFMKRMTDMQMEDISVINCSYNKSSSLTDEERKIMDDSNCRILVYELSGPMSFSSAKGMARQLATYEDYDLLILDLSEVPIVDFTTSLTIKDIIDDAEARGRHALLVGSHPKTMGMLNTQGVLHAMVEGHVCEARIDAFSKAAAILKRRLSAAHT